MDKPEHELVKNSTEINPTFFAQRRDCEVKMTTSQRPGMLNVSVQETGHALDGAAAKYTDGVETTE